MPRALVLAVLLILFSTVASAQTCRGVAPFQRRVIYPFVRGLFSEQTTRYGGGVGLGGSRTFGDLSVEWVGIDPISGTGFGLGGDAGLELPLDIRQNAQLCPLAEVAFAQGPNDAGGTNAHYQETDFALGVTAGGAVNGTSHTVSIIPTASFALVIAHNRFTDAVGTLLSSHTRFSEVITLGMGLVVSDEVSLTASVSYAAWAGGSSKGVGVRFTFVPGSRRSVPVTGSPPTSCTGRARGDSTVYDTTQVTERPRLRTTPELRYPLMQRDLAIGGRVIVGVVIEADGAPNQDSLTIMRKVNPVLDREAIRWIGGASYWPACRAGEPVRVRIAQPVDFCPAGCGQRRP